MPVAVYSYGPPQRPPITHDNGFLDRFPSRPPTTRDQARLAQWVGQLEAAEAAQGIPLVPHNDIPDALAAYRHFLFGEGEPREFSYERYVANDPSGATTLHNLILDAKEGVELLTANQSPNQSLAFQMTGTAIPVGGGPHSGRFPYPQTENWQKAIGAHVVWLSADVSMTIGPTKTHYAMELTVHAEDRYNFNPGASDIATGIPDAANGIFEVTGMAHQYMNRSTMTRSVNWDSSSTHAPQVGSGPSRRQRRPSDNRRIRNRL